MAKTPLTPAPPAAASGNHPLLIGFVVLGVIALAGFLVLALQPKPAPERTAGGPATAPASTPITTTTSARAPAPAEPPPPAPVAAAPPAVKKTPASGPLPPLPMLGFVPPRPIDTVRAVFEFAARRPDVLEYVPCFCGCERSGHRGNDDCFVKSRDAKGNVEWDPHGMS